MPKEPHNLPKGSTILPIMCQKVPYSVPSECCNVPKEFQNVPQELQNVPQEPYNVPKEPCNVYLCCSVCCSMLQRVLQCVSRCVSTSYLSTSGVTFFSLKVVFECVAMCHDSFLFVQGIISMCTTTHIYVCVMTHFQCTMTHMYEYHKSWTISVVLEI